MEKEVTLLKPKVKEMPLEERLERCRDFFEMDHMVSYYTHKKLGTVKEWVDAAFKCLDLDYTKYVKMDPRFLRPAEVDLLVGDSTKAKKVLGWKPRVSFNELVDIMVKADYDLLKSQTQ